MLVVLDHNENILEFLDEDLASITIDDVYKGYETVTLEYPLQDIIKDKYLFKQGNKIFTENCLFIINTECKIDYVNQNIQIDADEIISELNYTEPFYIHDRKYSRYVSGNTLKISLNSLQLLVGDIYEISKTDLPGINDSLKNITVNGTITRYNLLKQIEDELNLVCKREYSIENNKIIKKISMLKPENYGVEHSQLIESVTLGENTNKLTYLTDESKNALGIMPIITSEDTDTVKYSKILEQFNNLDVNNEKSEPQLNQIIFTNENIKTSAINCLAQTNLQGYIPEKILVNNIYIGLGQFLELLTSYILGRPLKLDLISNPEYQQNTSINAQFKRNDIISLAKIVNQYCDLFKKAPVEYNTANGTVNTQILTLIFMSYIVNNGKTVIVNTQKYHALARMKSEFIQENIYSTVEWDNFEYMPFIYTQNSSNSNNIPFKASMSQITGKTSYDITNYISESLPVMTIKKIAGATDIILEIFKKNISQDTAESFRIKFKNVSQLQDNSNIEIDFSKKTIKCMKYVETTETVTQEVTTANNNVITVNHMPSCGHCRGTPYKRYTKTWIKKCPFCGSTNLKDNPKRVYEGEVTCGNCDADFCGYCGYEKLSRPRQHLTPGNANTTTTESKTITRGEYKEVTASEDVNTESSETKIGLYEVITEQSSLDTLYGDVSIIITGATLEKITCDSTKLYELAPFPYIKKRNTQYIYAPVTSADFNYTHVADNTPKLEPFETSEQSVEEVLIGCWKKLNGSGDNTKWLEKAENIEVDLVETNTQYNVGDYVYIKLPDTRVFKAQIIETSYNTKLKQDKNIKIGNITKESII